jgi:hypothetical protein
VEPWRVQCEEVGIRFSEEKERIEYPPNSGVMVNDYILYGARLRGAPLDMGESRSARNDQ